MEGRMTVCNLSIEMGARGGMNDRYWRFGYEGHLYTKGKLDQSSLPIGL
jgi:homoaconitase/3-isopropylmalate dehydratase large subunit